MGKYIHRDGRGPRSPTFPSINMEALAQSAGISRSQVSKIFSGKSKASVTTLVAISQSLGITIDELIQRIRTGNGDGLAIQEPVKEKE